MARPSLLAAMLGVAMLLMLTPCARAAQREDCLRGYPLILRGEEARVFAACHALALRGDRRAEGMLATLYWDGFGTAQDTAQTIHWYTKAADQGDILAMFELGVLYAGPAETSRGAPLDRVAAYTWFTLAVETAGRFETRIREWGEPNRLEIPAVAKVERDKLEPRMTRAQIDQARQDVARWLREHARP